MQGSLLSLSCSIVLAYQSQQPIKSHSANKDNDDCCRVIKHSSDTHAHTHTHTNIHAHTYTHSSYICIGVWFSTVSPVVVGSSRCDEELLEKKPQKYQNSLKSFARLSL